MRKDINLMFCDYSQKFKLKWGKIFHGGIDKTANELMKLSKNYGCVQKQSDNDIVWLNKDDKPEAMFCLVEAANDLARIKGIYDKIENTKIPITFVIVHQLSDGPGNYDIFNLSERSYLVHNNRARYRTSKQ